MDNASLTNEVQALVNQEPRTWAQIASILDAVANNEFWRNDKSSFTAWVQWIAEKMSVKPATLWRYLSAGRYYITFEYKSKLAIKTVPLWDVPVTVSPENLEILSKLERVVPEDVFTELAEKVLTGNIKRSYLRVQWESYSRQFNMPSNRGRGVKALPGSPLVIYNSLKIWCADIRTAFRTKAPTWTGHKFLDAYRIFTDIALPPSEEGLSVRFESVAAIKHHDNGHEETDLHGVIIYDDFLETGLHLRIDCHSRYVNYLWWLLPFHYNGPMSLPEGAGILVCNNSRLEVIRTAKRCQPQSKYSDALLRKLMFEK